MRRGRRVRARQDDGNDEQREGNAYARESHLILYRRPPTIRRASSRGTAGRSRGRRAGEGAECRGRTVRARAWLQRARVDRVTIAKCETLRPDRRMQYAGATLSPWADQCDTLHSREVGCAARWPRAHFSSPLASRCPGARHSRARRSRRRKGSRRSWRMMGRAARCRPTRSRASRSAMSTPASGRNARGSPSIRRRHRTCPIRSTSATLLPASTRPSRNPE